MKKSTKHLLGLSGLALVAAMTTVAYNIPSSAEAQSAGGDVNVQVEVYSSHIDTDFQSPQDGAQFTNPVINVSNVYSSAEDVAYTLYYEGSAIGSWSVDVSGNGNDTFAIDLKSGIVTLRNGATVSISSNNRRGLYMLKATARNSSGVTHEDSVSFTYSTAAIDPSVPGSNIYTGDEAPTEPTGDPEFSVDLGEEVEKIVIKVYDENGNLVLEYETTAEEIAKNGGKIKLPFDENELASGRYTIKIFTYGYDENGNLVQLEDGAAYTFRLWYIAPDGSPAPAVPDTGSISIGGLNISRMDYIITGLVIFGSATIAAFILIRRRNRR